MYMYIPQPQTCTTTSVHVPWVLHHIRLGLLLLHTFLVPRIFFSEPIAQMVLLFKIYAFASPTHLVTSPCPPWGRSRNFGVPQGVV